MPLALQNRALLEGEKKAKRHPEKGRKRVASKGGKKRTRENRSEDVLTRLFLFLEVVCFASRGLFNNLKRFLGFLKQIHCFGEGYLPDTLSWKGALPDTLAIPKHTCPKDPAY